MSAAAPNPRKSAHSLRPGSVLTEGWIGVSDDEVDGKYENDAGENYNLIDDYK